MSGAPAPEGGRSFRTFLVLWSTQTLSLFGSFVTQFAINIWLTLERYPRPEQKGELALALTACAVASTLPLVFFMPLAGAFADRHDRRRILFVANVVSAALTAVLLVLHASHLLSLPAAVVLLAGYALAGSFHSAAFDSAYATLVPDAQLGRANGMMQTSFALSQVVAPGIAAVLIGLPALARAGRVPLPASLSSGVPFAFAADGLSFAIAAAAVAALRFPPAVRSERGASVWHDTFEGFAWIVKRRPFLWLISFGGLANLTFAPLLLLMPLLVRDRLAADCAARHLSYEAALALVNSVMGLGGVVGGVLMTVWGGLRRRLVYGMIGSMIVLGAGQVVAGLSTTVAAFATGLFLSELLVPALNAHSFLLWKDLTPPGMLARALSTRRFIAQSAFPAGTMISGWLAAKFEPWIVVTIAGGTLATWCTVMMLTPSFATLEARMRESAARD
ncbi:MAG: MFS transporter [Candidatus Eisenbacteria bacterium]|uniref:MFS transporter n=1 Tax=Eiseniibacteriota bacterium TaxID=2212470 RepID=A0A933W8W7_UNCEI|nr:MFS transporter [Candidatus Eisenbacteria bacterium]